MNRIKADENTAILSNFSKQETVIDRFWMWAHEAGAYIDTWNLPDSLISPTEAAFYMGLQNLLFVKYNEEPKCSFRQLTKFFDSFNKVICSITGADGITSKEERQEVFELIEDKHNIIGVWLDDFFRFDHQWLSEKNAQFPVFLEIKLPQLTRIAKIELAQVTVTSGEHRTANYAIETMTDTSKWEEILHAKMPNQVGAKVEHILPCNPIRAIRIRFLDTYDIRGARGCGLSGIRVWTDSSELTLDASLVTVSSVLSERHTVANILPGIKNFTAMSLSDLKMLRDRLQTIRGKKLDIGLTVYTPLIGNELVRPYLELCDIFSIWTWNPDDLDNLESNLNKLTDWIPSKKIWLGCYMYDFDKKQPIPIEKMKRQCEMGLKWLKSSRIDGMIFLGSNLCDLNFEAVEWTRNWIAEVGDCPLRN